MFPAPPLEPGRDLNDIARWEYEGRPSRILGAVATATAPRVVHEQINVAELFKLLDPQQQSEIGEAASSVVEEPVEVADDPPVVEEPPPKPKGKKRKPVKSRTHEAVDNKTSTQF